MAGPDGALMSPAAVVPPGTTALWEAVVGQPDLVTTLSHAAADAARIRRGESGPVDDARVVADRPAGFGALHRGPCVRGRAPVS